MRDGTAYNTVQEAVEHKNLIDKRNATNTTGNMDVKGPGVCGWGQLIQNQLILEELRRRKEPITATYVIRSSQVVADIGWPKFAPRLE